MLNNKKARYDYHILDEEIAGIVLVGTELKSLREGKASIKEAYVFIDEQENAAYLKGMYIANDENDAYSHDPYRLRKLLMTKKQIKKWIKETQSGGTTIVALKAYFNNRNVFKLNVALAKGKKLYDKRSKILKKQSDREISKHNI
jgi:SsrA-binding protein